MMSRSSSEGGEVVYSARAAAVLLVFAQERPSVLFAFCACLCAGQFWGAVESKPPTPRALNTLGAGLRSCSMRRARFLTLLGTLTRHTYFNTHFSHLTVYEQLRDPWPNPWKR